MIMNNQEAIMDGEVSNLITDLLIIGMGRQEEILLVLKEDEKGTWETLEEYLKAFCPAVLLIPEEV